MGVPLYRCSLTESKPDIPRETESEAYEFYEGFSLEWGADSKDRETLNIHFRGKSLVVGSAPDAERDARMEQLNVWYEALDERYKYFSEPLESQKQA